MSISRSKQMSTDNLGQATVRTHLMNLQIHLNATFEREVVLNPGTEYESKLVQDWPNVQEDIVVNPLNEDEWSTFLQNNQTVQDLVSLIEVKADKLFAIIGPPKTQPEAVIPESYSVEPLENKSTKTSKK